MKAVAPVRPQDSSSGSGELSARCVSKQSLSIGRCRAEEEDVFCLQYDMNDCYSRLKRLVPTIPQDKKVSKVEILQHVIDYILDLQLALETHPSLHKQQQPQRTGTCPPAASNPGRTPLTVLNVDHHQVSLNLEGGGRGRGDGDGPCARATGDSPGTVPHRRAPWADSDKARHPRYVSLSFQC